MVNLRYSCHCVNLDGYHLIRKDRSSGPGGGVAVYISSNISCSELSVENVDDQNSYLDL